MSNSIFYISTKHYVGNGTYRFTFPTGQSLKLNKGSQCGVSSCNIYNSFFNITSQWSNNVFYIFSNQLNLSAIPDSYSKGASFTTNTGDIINMNWVQIVVTDGYFDVPRLNYYLQQKLIEIGFYLQNNVGENMYFYEFETNPSVYKCQVNLLVMPTTLPAGFSYPSNSCFTLPATAQTPYIYFPTSSSQYGSLANILGFQQGSFLPYQPNGVARTTISENVSTLVPMVSVVSDVIFTINIVNNPLTNPSNSFFSIPITSAFGALCTYNYYPVLINTIDSSVPHIELKLYDQNFNPLLINDTQFSLGLLVQSPTEQPKQKPNH